MHLKKKRHLLRHERDNYSTTTTTIATANTNSAHVHHLSYGTNNMADNAREVRIEEQLKVKIGEAKNLSSRNAANTSCSTQGTRDVYCTIALDQEEICRTPTVERTLSPFFGEEYQFKIPRRFRYLSIYVWDRDRHMKQDKTIGKIAIKREELHMYNHKDHWFSLRPVDSDSEVQGMAYIQLQFEDANNSMSMDHRHHHNQQQQQHQHQQQQSQQQHHHLHHHHHHSHHQQQQQRVNLLRPSDAHDNLEDFVGHHQHQAMQNDYKEQTPSTPLTTGNLGGQQHQQQSSRNHQQHQKVTYSSINDTATLKNFAHNSFSAKYSKVIVRVPECVDLPKKNGTCDPYVVCTALYSNNRQISKRTKLRKKTVNPEFDEVMSFEACIDCDNATTSTSICKNAGVQQLLTTFDSNTGLTTIGNVNNSCNSTTTTTTTTITNNPADNNNINNTHHSTHSQKGYSIYPISGGTELYEITVTLWHDASGMSDKVFLGEVKIPIRNVLQQQQLSTENEVSAWYYLQPRSVHSLTRSLNSNTHSCATPPGTRLSSDNTIGSLRLKLLYTADHVFPLATYDDLMNLLLESVDQRPIVLSSVFLLGELASCKTDVAQPLVRLFTHTGKIVAIIKVLADHEISNLTDSTTIFRGNTLVSKMMDEAMRLTGLPYLHQTLRPVLMQILNEKKPCEIDPSRVKDRSVVDTNLHHLQDYVEKVFDAITKSSVRCPKVLCEIFHYLRECAERYFPRNREVRYSVVSGFIFLRFFAPAILGPKLFDLTNEPLDCQTNRTLTLISKSIQSLGNLVSSRSLQQPCKEEYTGQLYKKFCTEKHVEAVKLFLENISTYPQSIQEGGSNNDNCIMMQNSNNYLLMRPESDPQPVLLKEGMMTKYPQCRKRFGRRPLKQRYFRLTTHSLNYAKSKGKPPICDIPLEEIERVEQLNAKNFKMQNCFKIIHRERSLILQTLNCVEEREWIDLLHKICLTNSVRSQFFHPSAFVNGVYSCCSRSDENAPGCKNISAAAMDYLQMDLITALDPALDLQRIHTLIMSHMSQLEAFLEQAKSTITTFNPVQQQQNPLIATASSLQQQSPNLFTKFKAVVIQLREVAFAIDKDHRNYKQGIARELKYGSRQAPIGDDNYLHMMRTVGHMHNQPQPQTQQLHPRAQHQQQQQHLEQVLPQMQLFMAYPYHQQHQQQQKQQQHIQQQQQFQSNNLHAYSHNLNTPSYRHISPQTVSPIIASHHQQVQQTQQITNYQSTNTPGYYGQQQQQQPQILLMRGQQTPQYQITPNNNVCFSSTGGTSTLGSGVGYVTGNVTTNKYLGENYALEYYANKC